MTYTLRKAVTSEVKPLVGLYSESGGGKTHSALMLACGFVGGDMSQVAMIETESGRGEAWADDAVVGGYNVLSLRSDFSPKEYGAAISAAEKAGVKALIVDSASHEWEGVGGVLAMAAKNQEDGKKGPIVWQQPKLQHAREFMLRLTQTPIPLVIVCMRAKYVMEEKVVNGRKDWTRSTDLSPKQSEDILFEMFVHGWLDKEKHFFHGTKYTRESMRQIFVDGQPITVDTGKRLAEWAAGKKTAPITQPGEAQAPMTAGTSPAAPADPTTGMLNIGSKSYGPAKITPDEAIALEARCTDNNIKTAIVKKFLAVEQFSQLTPAQLIVAHENITVTLAKRMENAP